VIVIDPKSQFSWGSSRSPERRGFIAKNLADLQRKAAKTIKTGDPIIYRPDASALDPENAFGLDAVYEMAYQRGNTLVYIDELYFLANGTDFAKRAPWFFRCVIAGRSRGVGVWSAYQRPSWIPLIAMTETECRAVFYLRITEDQRRIDSSFGKVDWQALQKAKHTFAISTDLGVSPPCRLKA